MPKQKYYVVWAGLEPGIYTAWEECRRLVEGVSGARFKAFASLAEAEAALLAALTGRTPAPTPQAPPAASAPAPAREPQSAAPEPQPRRPEPQAETPEPQPCGNGAHEPCPDGFAARLPREVALPAVAVDAACSGNPGPMEYRGIDLQTGAEIFRFGPVHGTNNIGEFLAIVHALALLKAQGRTATVYSDSRNAMLWVRKKQCRTTLARTPRTEKLYELIGRAEHWLKTNDTRAFNIVKWDTKRWGEVPADFGRK